VTTQPAARHVADAAVPSARPPLQARDLAEVKASERLHGTGCPICATSAAAEVRTLDAVIAEAVTDPGVRRRLRAAGGYCPRHTALLPLRERARRGGTLGSAILLADVLEARLAALRDATDVAPTRGLGRRRRRRPTLTEARRPAACPACADAASSVEGFLTVVLGRIGDPAWAAALSQAEFCLDHLLLTWEAAAGAGDRPAALWRPIGQAHLARLAGAVATAADYVAHSAHGRSAELTDDERRAADTLVRILAGDERAG